MLFTRRKPTIKEKIETGSKKLEPELRDLVVKRKTLIALLSFTVGGVLIGNVLYSLAAWWLGQVGTVLLGFLLFVIGGSDKGV